MTKTKDKPQDLSDPVDLLEAQMKLTVTEAVALCVEQVKKVNSRLRNWHDTDVVVLHRFTCRICQQVIAEVRDTKEAKSAMAYHALQHGVKLLKAK